MIRFTCLLLVILIPRVSFADPPFQGTIYLDPDILMKSDPTTFQTVNSAGQGQRQMYDRRFGWIQNFAFLFNAVYSDGLVIEVQVNSEFGSTELAEVEAEKYAVVIGRLPKALRRDAETVWIHKGVEPFGGGNNNLLIHVGQGEIYDDQGILEETLIHEAVHTSLDAEHAASSGWLSARASDNEFISTYARDYPEREDLAESFLPFVAVTLRPERISNALRNTIEATIPNRIGYFESLNLDMLPMKKMPASIDIDGNDQYDALTDGLLLLRGMFGLNGSALVTGTIASDAIYTGSVDIESRIEILGNLADIDGNGDIDALTDGLLTLRYLFGLQGDTLINGVIAEDAIRTTSEEIEAHLETLMPAL